MKIIRASHLGMCFGVRDAITFAHAQAAIQPLTVLGDLVHNDDVLTDLEKRGVRMALQPKAVETSVAMITAHGASEKAKSAAQTYGLSLLDATCPLVKSAHRALQTLVTSGFHPVVIGQRGHVEVNGLTGDLSEFDVALTEEEIKAIPAKPRFGVVSQTTQPIGRVRRLVEILRESHPSAEIKFADTVCQPTKLRQQAAEELAALCDVVIVVGGAHSNNTRELARTCGIHGARVFHVQRADDLRPEWFAGAETIGLTAGTSTPDFLIFAVEDRLRSFDRQEILTITR